MKLDTQTLSIEQAAGQLLIIGFKGDGTSPPEFVTQALEQSTIGGVILFRRNVKDIDQIVALNTHLHQAASSAPMRPFICVDQEGGRVVRLREPLTPIGPMRQLGDVKQMRVVSDIAEVIGTELQVTGFNVNFAPVLDVDTNPNNPVIGDRAFSDDPEKVTRLGAAFTMGHIMAGVIPCGKHFPGHGDTDLDSHLALPTLLHDNKRLNKVELHPFNRMVRAKIPMLMTAHVVVTAVDPVYPATLSPEMINGILREKIGFDGVVVSDCLEMKAVSEFAPIEELVERGVRAGVDLFLICHTREKWARAHAHLVKVAGEDEAFRDMIYASLKRIATLKEDFLGNMPNPWTPAEGWRDVLGCQMHRDIVARGPWQTTSEGVDPTEST